MEAALTIALIGQKLNIVSDTKREMLIQICTLITQFVTCKLHYWNENIHIGEDRPTPSECLLNYS